MWHTITHGIRPSQSNIAIVPVFGQKTTMQPYFWMHPVQPAICLFLRVCYNTWFVSPWKKQVHNRRWESYSFEECEWGL